MVSDQATLKLKGLLSGTIAVSPANQKQGSLPAYFFRELLGIQRAFAASAPLREYLVTVTGGNVASLSGAAVLVFASSAGITDAAGQSLVSVIPTGNNQSTITTDTEAPVVAQITTPAQVNGTFDATIIFSEPVTGFGAGDIVVTNATVNSVNAQAPAGGFATIYVVAMTPIAHGQLTIGVAGGAVEDAAGNLNPVSRTVSVDFLDTDYVQTRTGAVIHNFLAQRGANILASQPDLSGRLMDQGGLGATEKFAFSTNYQPGSLQLNFA